MYCWVLKKPYSPLSSCLRVHSQSSHLLPPTSYIFRGGSLGQVPVHVLWPTVAHVGMEGWRLSGGLSVALSCFLFSGGWDLRVCSLAVNKKYQKTAINYLWSFQVYEPEKLKVSEGCLSAVVIPVIRRTLWDQCFNATMGEAGRWAAIPWMKTKYMGSYTTEDWLACKNFILQ